MSEPQSGLDLPAEYVQHVRATLYPVIRDSAVYVGLTPSGEPDVKWCLELGTAIMFDKPIVVVAWGGRQIPAGLRRIAHQVIETDSLESDDFRRQLDDAIARLSPEEPGGADGG